MKPTDADFNVNPDRLDEEWLRQPPLRLQYGMKYADAKRDWDLAKRDVNLLEDELEEVEARLSLEVRKDPEAFGLGTKPTVDAVKQTVLLHPHYAKALDKLRFQEQEVIHARHLVDVLESAGKAMDDRKKTLEDLVFLHGMCYRASPKAPKGMRDKMNEVETDAAFGRRKPRGN